MAMTETARLERETEETRAQLEQTLGELRARMSPGQLLDQATDYLRHNRGREFIDNLRDQIVDNPLPVTLIGAGIAWLAISGAVGGRRSNGNGRAHIARDWGETAGMTDDLAHGGRGPSAAQRARQTAEGWADDAREAASEAGDTIREGMYDVRERASTLYDETAGRAQEAASEAGDTIREGMDDVRERAGEMRERAAGMYGRTMGRARRVAGKASDYGRAARHAVEPNGALMNFCREQPMLVAGLGIAVGAALAAMIPASRAETRVMGDASRNLRDRVSEAASDTMRAAAMERESDQARPDGPAKPERGADGIYRSLQQAEERSNVDSEPQSAAPYAEAAEAGAATSGENITEGSRGGEATQRS